MTGSKVVFIDNKTKLEFEKSAKNQRLHHWLVRAIEDLEVNVFCGVHIPKKLIPKKYIKKYQVKNLWKYNLPNGWRLLYSIKGSDIIIVSIILEWLNHKDYEAVFKY